MVQVRLSFSQKKQKNKSNWFRRESISKVPGDTALFVGLQGRLDCKPMPFQRHRQPSSQMHKLDGHNIYIYIYNQCFCPFDFSLKGNNYELKCVQLKNSSCKDYNEGNYDKNNQNKDDQKNMRITRAKPRAALKTHIVLNLLLSSLVFTAPPCPNSAGLFSIRAIMCTQQRTKSENNQLVIK